MKKFSACLTFLMAAASLQALSIPSEWNFGRQGDRKPISYSIAVVNDEKSPLSIRLISPCDCLTIRPDAFTLQPGAHAAVSLTFDPTGYSGPVDKAVLVRVKDGVDRILDVHGTIAGVLPPVPNYPGECEWCKKQSEENRRIAYESWRSQEHVIRYYYSPGCASCVAFMDREVPRVAGLLGLAIEVDRLDIRVPGVLDELADVLAEKKKSLLAFPVLVIGNTVLQGEREIAGSFLTEEKKRLMKSHG
jgi:hypothetical protein